MNGEVIGKRLTKIQCNFALGHSMFHLKGKVSYDASTLAR